MQKYVMIPAMTLVNAHNIITVPSPYLLAIGSNKRDPVKAPALPAAADMPFRVLLQFSEKVIEGSINVVVFGPKFEKKNVFPYKSSKSQWCSVRCSHDIPIMRYNKAMIAKP